MSNALTSCNTETLRKIYNNHKMDLIARLFDCVRSLSNKETKLKKNLVDSIENLLKLDHLD